MRQDLVGAAAVAAAAVVLVAVGWMLWPRPAAVTGPSAAASTRPYLDTSACLLTGTEGVTPGTAGARVWQGLESASAATRVMVSYLPVARPADADAMLNTLVERRCGVIVVMDASLVQVASAAKANPGRQFILVASSTAAGPAAAPPNAVVVPAADASRRINQAVTALAGTA
jgi:hypothetical protein